MLSSICSCCFAVDVDDQHSTEDEISPQEVSTQLSVENSNESQSEKSNIDPVLLDAALECLCLKKNVYDRLLVSLGENLKRVLSNSKPPHVEKKISGEIKFENLSMKGVLGRGAFGTVELVKDKISKETFALKSVSKSLIVKRRQQQHIMNERRIMALLDSPFVVKLHDTFNHDQHLRFLMEPVLGGELFSVLRQKIKFCEATARFYVASIVLAFEHMHAFDVIYRDLKPENVLLDAIGYIKLTDFGFAKIVKESTKTLCGTPDYLAPEVVRGQPHSKPVDWYTLGILMFEMLSSYPPYYSSNQQKTYKKILKGIMAFPPHFSSDAKSLVKGLTHGKVSRRFGSTSIDKIKNHSWFNGFDWTALENRTMIAPIIPKIKNNSDISNFEKYPDHHQKLPRYFPDDSNWDAEF